MGSACCSRPTSQYPVLALTATGIALLKDEASCPELTLARQRPPTKGAPRPRSRVEAESWQDVDRDLFERLRAVRLEIARARGVPPYVIFHDATLREMARLRPTSMAALLTVKGVGARKADDLGEIFLAATIRERRRGGAAARPDLPARASHGGPEAMQDPARFLSQMEQRMNHHLRNATIVAVAFAASAV